MKAHAPRLFPVIVLSVALFLPLTATAEKRPAIPSIGETIEVNIVDVDVIVTGKDGRRVRGLKREDFVILENGKPREISNFAEYASPGAGGDVASAPTQTRTILIFLERTKLPPFDAERLMESLGRTLHNIVRRGDAVGLVVWDQARQVRIDFTDDLSRIDFALETMKRELAGPVRVRGGDDVTREVNDSQDLEERSAAFDEERDLGGNVTTARSWATVIERVGSMDSLTELSRMKRRVNAINAAINSMGSVEGKKVLLLATERLGEVIGGDYEYDPSTDILSVDVRQRFATSDLIDSIIRNANSVGVTVYPAFTSMREGRDSVEEVAKIAHQTGGVEAAGTGRFADLMETFEEDMTDYYSLAYRIESSGADRKRTLVVKTRDPKLTVRSRRSYVEKSDQTRMKDRLMAALFRSTNDSMFRIQAQLGASKKQRRSVDTLPLQVRIPIDALTVVPENGARVGAFSVYVLSSAGGDEMSTISQQTRRFEIQPTGTPSGHFTYDFDLLINRKADRLAVGVLDELSKSYAVLRVAVPTRE